MADRHIICVEPASGRGELVVVEVQQDGAQPLDLRLVGCEGENPYVTSIKQRNLSKLKQKFKGSDDEWTAVISHFLLQQPGKDKGGSLHGVRLVYTLKDDLELSFRQDVQGIKVTWGEIVLPRDDDFEFNPFEWAQTSAKAHEKTLKELADLQSRASSEQDTIAKLNAQLDDFIKTKNETETAMLQQFMQLLNEKKRKIRDQSRLLATAKVDSSIATAVHNTRQDTKSRRAGASRQSKRKAPAQAADMDLKSESGDDDQMEIDQAKEEEQDSDQGPAATPDHSDDETDEKEDAVPSVRAKSSETLRASSVTKASQDEPKLDGKPPPKRELPFGRPATRSRQPDKQPEPVPDDDDDDDTDDEEL